MWTRVLKKMETAKKYWGGKSLSYTNFERDILKFHNFDSENKFIIRYSVCY